MGELITQILWLMLTQIQQETSVEALRMRNGESDECLCIIGELSEKITEHPHTQTQTVDSDITFKPK